MLARLPNAKSVRWLAVIALACAWVVQVRADDDEANLRRMIEEQQRQIEGLKQQIDQRVANQEASKQSTDPSLPLLDGDAVKKIVADYLRDNPGAGMPSGVQTGFEVGRGFIIRSAPNPKYIQWEDECRIPFELRIKGRLQIDYYGYKVTDRTNHLTNVPATQNANSVRLADFSQLEIVDVPCACQAAATMRQRTNSDESHMKGGITDNGEES